MLTRILFLGGLTAAITMAASPVGVIMSRGAVRLGGVTVTTKTVTFAPVLPKETIQTTTAPATLTLKSGTTYTIPANTTTTLSATGNPFGPDGPPRPAARMAIATVASVPPSVSPRIPTPVIAPPRTGRR